MNNGTFEGTAAARKIFGQGVAGTVGLIGERTPETAQAIDNLSESIEALHSAVNELVDRIQSVLRQQLPEETSLSKSTGFSSPLADNIQSRASSIHAAVGDLRNVLSRLEL
jgi:hypothetical protein